MKNILQNDIRGQVAQLRQKRKPLKLFVRNTVLATFSIGDFFALESFLSDEQRNAVHTVLYAMQKHQQIKQLIEALPNFPNLTQHKVIWNDFNNFWHFLRKDEVVNKL